MYANAISAKGDEVAWPRAAAEVSADLQLTWGVPGKLPGITDTQQWINQTGNVILDYRWNDLKLLYQSPTPLTGSAAFNWDNNILRNEQQQVQSQYSSLHGAEAFWTESGAAVVPWLFHPADPHAPVWNIKDPNERIQQGMDVMDGIRKDPNEVWGN